MSSKSKAVKVRRWAAGLSAGTLALCIAIPAASLRPVDRAEWSKSEPLQEAVAIVSSIHTELAESKPAILEAGWAAVPLTIEVGDPLAGYGARRGAPSTGPGESLWARALYLRAAAAEVVFVTADILLVHATVAAEVMDACAASGIDRESIYFTATHTHCGPGGWGPNLIEESVCGSFDPAIVSRLADDLGRAILAAKAEAGPAEWAWLETTAPEYLRNRTVPGGTIDPALEAIAVRRADRGSASIGLFAFFGAHATCLGPDRMTFHGDYPGVFVRELESKGIDFAAFGAASAGSQSPAGKGENEERAQSIGAGLAGRLLPQLDAADWKRTVTLGTARKSVPLPDFQLRLTDNLRIAEWITDGLHSATAPIHFVRLDHHRLAGLPVEYSSLLSAPLREEAGRHGIALTPTVFNGDYAGYVLPREIYDSGAYEARMNFLGPGGGAYFTELIRVGAVTGHR